MREVDRYLPQVLLLFNSGGLGKEIITKTSLDINFNILRRGSGLEVACEAAKNPHFNRNFTNAK